MMKNSESIKNDLYRKDQTLNTKAMNSVFAGGVIKTKYPPGDTGETADIDSPENSYSDN